MDAIKHGGNHFECTFYSKRSQSLVYGDVVGPSPKGVGAEQAWPSLNPVVSGYKNLPYDERLRRLGLTTLEARTEKAKR